MTSRRRLLTILALSFPVAISRLGVTLMGLVDTYFVGTEVGTTALAAVGIGVPILWTATCFFEGTLTGVNTWSAQFHGAGKAPQTRIVGWQGIYLALVGGLLLMAFSPLTESMFSLGNLPAETHDLSVAYTERVLLGAILILITAAVAGYLQGIGDTRTPMWITLASNVVNAVLDYLFIGGHWGFEKQGVLGAANATVIASGFAAALSLWVFLQHTQLPRFCGLRNKELRGLLSVGSNTGLQWLSDMVAFSIFIFVVNEISPEAGAANTILFRLTHLSFMPALGVGVALTTLIGQRCGAGDHEEANRIHHVGLRLVVVYMSVMALLYVIFRRPIVAVFTEDPAVVDAAAAAMFLVAGFQLGDAFAVAASGSLRGAGDVRFLKLWMVFSGYALFLPCTFLFVKVFDGGLVGAWVAAALHISVFGVGVEMRWLCGRWRSLRLVEPAPPVPSREADEAII